MRKIITQIEHDITDFTPYQVVKMKPEDGDVVELDRQRYIESRYTPKQQNDIDRCNRVLSKKNMPEMTEEEINFMLDPYGFRERLTTLSKEMENSKAVQRLAGFKVDTKITEIK